MFSGIKSELFDSPEFKEDSVRELIIAPMIARLGYGPVGDMRVVRSKTLQHPFIRVGTSNHPVTTIPDYILYVDDKPRLALDAKGPGEDIHEPKHKQQAYSYAIHPEIRCDHFPLCNGRELAVFEVSSDEPILSLPFGDFETNWDTIEKFLAPKYLREPILRRFDPDFGMALKRMGFTEDTELTLIGARLNLFVQMDETLITAMAGCDMGFGTHLVSFDFDRNLLDAILSGLPEKLKNAFSEALLRKAPFQASAGLHVEVDIKAHLGEEIQGDKETFVPLRIKEVIGSRFNIFDVPSADKDDIPSHIFKLRDAFRINN
jgi:hypothetical protein